MGLVTAPPQHPDLPARAITAHPGGGHLAAAVPVTSSRSV